MIPYGSTPEGIAADKDMLVERAIFIYNKIMESFPGIPKHIRKQFVDLSKKGYLKSLTGRTYYIQGADSEKKYERKAAQRYAVNYPIQGTGSDINVMAMGIAFDLKREANLITRFISTVHDSLVADTPKSEVVDLLDIYKETVSRINELDILEGVPMKADIEIGLNMMDKVKVKSYGRLDGDQQYLNFSLPENQEKKEKIIKNIIQIANRVSACIYEESQDGKIATIVF